MSENNGAVVLLAVFGDNPLDYLGRFDQPDMVSSGRQDLGVNNDGAARRRCHCGGAGLVYAYLGIDGGFIVEGMTAEVVVVTLNVSQL